MHRHAGCIDLEKEKICIPVILAALWSLGKCRRFCAYICYLMMTFGERSQYLSARCRALLCNAVLYCSGAQAPSVSSLLVESLDVVSVGPVTPLNHALRDTCLKGIWIWILLPGRNWEETCF